MFALVHYSLRAVSIVDNMCEPGADHTRLSPADSYNEHLGEHLDPEAVWYPPSSCRPRVGVRHRVGGYFRRDTFAHDG